MYLTPILRRKGEDCNEIVHPSTVSFSPSMKWNGKCKGAVMAYVFTYLKSFPCLFRAIVRLFGWETVRLVAARLVDPKAISMAFNTQVLWRSCIDCGCLVDSKIFIKLPPLFLCAGIWSGLTGAGLFLVLAIQQPNAFNNIQKWQITSGIHCPPSLPEMKGFKHCSTSTITSLRLL